MKILLTGEGSTDCGQEKRTSTGPIWEDGPVQIFLNKIADECSAPIEIMTISKTKIAEYRSVKRQRRAVSGLSGHGIKAFYVAQAAADQDCDVAALYADADTPRGISPKDKHQCKAWYDEVKRNMICGFSRGTISAAIAIIPMKMIECWLLGDSQTFTALWGRDFDPKYFRSPELIWGAKDDPSSDYPKNKLHRALAECNEEPNRETYCKIADASDISQLVESCPISFGDFYKQCYALFASVQE